MAEGYGCSSISGLCCGAPEASGPWWIIRTPGANRCKCSRRTHSLPALPRRRTDRSTIICVLSLLALLPIGGSFAVTLIDVVAVAVLPRWSEAVARGQAVVAHHPHGYRFVSRAVGLPGDTLEMRGKTLFINGRAQIESYVRQIDPENDPAAEDMLWQREYLLTTWAAPEPYQPTRDNWGPLVVPSDHYFLLGDDRDNSYDSRYWGFVADTDIIGPPVWIYFSREPPTGRARWGRVGQSLE
jgi:signal peptidase I